MKFFAMKYLNDYLSIDKPLIELINCKNQENRFKGVIEALIEYRVIRNFKETDEEKAEEEIRLAKAFDVYDKIEGPVNENNVVETVIQLSDKFAGIHGQNVISAASKLLWFKFKSPIIMLDKQAIEWLKTSDTNVIKTHLNRYGYYRECWINAYDDYKARIEQALENLHEEKLYTFAYEMEDADIKTLINNNWFKERVFDKYIWYNGGT